jgi:hypothetical protein
VLFASTHLDPGARAKQKSELDFRVPGKPGEGYEREWNSRGAKDGAAG